MMARGMTVPSHVIDAAIALMVERPQFLPVDIREVIDATWGKDLPEREREGIVRTAARNLIDLESRAHRIDQIGRGVYRRVTS